jgi:diaminopimelate epimerase
MPNIPFDKYQGTGNDFIMIDNRHRIINPDDKELISSLCHRRFGIGSDGLILIQNQSVYDFEMIYYNPDGTQSLCGNGSRCAVMYSYALGIIKKKTTFLTIEGPLKAEIQESLVHLNMPDVKEEKNYDRDFFIDTGSPHYVRFVPNADGVDIYMKGREIRYSKPFHPAGTNVNFVQLIGDGKIYVRTYERGVEQETLSCGTGVTASAIAAGLKDNLKEWDIRTRGGNLRVTFEFDTNGGYRDIKLIGPAEKVFSGQIQIK